MKFLLPSIVTAPTIVILGIVVLTMFTGRYFFDEFGIPSLVGLLPLLSFGTCVALSLVFPNAKEWRIAAAINGVPIFLALSVALLFALGGYHG